MFQDFEERSQGEHGPARIARLREAMREAGFDMWLVPHGDEHQSEYLPAHSERLAWLTGFTGSAGYCIVTREKAVMFTDGRYTLQVREQTDGETFTHESLIDTPPSKWIEANANKGDRIGFDPWLVPIRAFREFEKSAEKAGASLVETDSNPIDALWTDRPEAPLGKITIHPDELAGKSASQKLDELREELGKRGADLCLLTDPNSIAWAFNIRGGDVSHIPLPLSFALLRCDGKPLLFVDGRKLDNATRNALEDLAEIAEPGTLTQQLAELGKGATVSCDPALVPAILAQIIESSGGTVSEERDPVVLPRAIKNEAEIEGSRRAHLRDGVAVTRFLAWLDAQPADSLDEIKAAQKLEEFRVSTAQAMDRPLRDTSFDTISGAAAHAAIPHYRVSTKSNKPFQDNMIYLFDSGGQYEDGTTDITRTVAIGTPPAGSVADNTLVLKGHIALATARFPAGTTGRDLDVLARIAMWREGKDFNHGTGHGIGSYLSVHEGPQSISRRGTEAIRAGMIVSDEPGFYKEGEYGIRIENLLLVTEAETLEGGNISTHAFDTLTLAPIDRRLIDASMLNSEELNWLNAYHARVERELSPHLDDDTRRWLAAACAPIG